MVDEKLQDFANKYSEVTNEIRNLERKKEDREWYNNQIDKVNNGNVKYISMTFDLEGESSIFFCVKDEIKKELIELLLRDKEKAMQDLDNKIQEKENELKKIIENFNNK